MKTVVTRCVPQEAGALVGQELSPPADLTGMRLLLTGATGRVGARFLPELKRAGAQIRLMVWAPAGTGRESASLVIGDMCDPDVARRAVEGVDAIVHIASAFQGITSAEAYDVNYLATAGLLCAARAAGAARFVQLSSYLVYRDDLGRPAREDDPLRAVGTATFPAAKLGAERAVAEATEAGGDGFDVCVLRVAFTYGEGDPHLADAFTWARRSPGRRRLHLIHHADVRQGVLRALGTRHLCRRVYNLADDEPVTAAELASYAAGFRWQGEEHGWDDLADGTGFQNELDCAAAARDLGFRPAYRTIRDACATGAM